MKGAQQTGAVCVRLLVLLVLPLLLFRTRRDSFYKGPSVNPFKNDRDCIREGRQGALGSGWVVGGLGSGGISCLTVNTSPAQPHARNFRRPSTHTHTQPQVEGNISSRVPHS